MSRTRPAEIVRQRLAGKTGRRFWRGLDDLAGTVEFRDALDAEFPGLKSIAPEVDRRQLMKVMAASFALAGLTGCTVEADEEALPYVDTPEFTQPGQPRWYATAVTLSGYAQPALGKTYTGRPVKLEGNPDHPAVGGASDVFQQAALLGLYDPDRSSAPQRLNRPASWKAFQAAMHEKIVELDKREGEGFRLLTGATSSPTLLRQISAMMARWPKARWHVHEPLGHDRRGAAIRTTFGKPLEPRYRFEEAEVVVSFDDDFLGPGPHQIENARGRAARRKAYRDGDGESRLFVAEPSPTLTGTAADDRLVASHWRMRTLLRALASTLEIERIPGETLSERENVWVERAAEALRAHEGRSLVTVGPYYIPELQSLGFLVNAHLGNLNRTLRFIDPVIAAPPDGTASFQTLIDDMRAGKVEAIAMVGVNPVYTSPVAIDFAGALEKVPWWLHAGQHVDETAAHCHWHLPLAHELESWSDARAVDGTASIIQPLVRPFTGGRSLHDIIDALTGGTREARTIVQETWRSQWGDAFDARWKTALLKGFIADSAPQEILPEIRDRRMPRAASPAPEGLALVLRADPTLWDGRFASNAWLQETPKPLTKVTWGNLVVMSPQLARSRKIRNGDEVRVDADGQSITGPAWIQPGQAADTLTVHIGHGRMRGGVAEGVGFNAFALQDGRTTWHRTGVLLARTGERLTIATTQAHQSMEGHDFVRTVTRADMSAREETAHEAEPSNFYPPAKKDGPSWGMSIDLDACIGCNACVVACVSENNIAMVGPELVAQGREMHWLRIDRYHEGPQEDPKAYFQPVPCMHCEDAPCEMGCPVNATMHSADGLNVQVYNRCIGTRTCSAYCPYKVRRFNWFDYTSDDPEPVKAMRSPEVTVRARGVMEKCTYCVQRISAARIKAKKEGREIADGEVVTACQQACPTQAITFGNINDPESAVTKAKASPRDYALLEETNTRPRTTYLARVEETKPGGGAS